MTLSVPNKYPRGGAKKGQGPISNSIKAFRVCAFSLCMLLNIAQAKKKDSEDVDRKMETLTRVISYVENNYIEGVDMSSALDKAIQGLVSSLDPHSSYLEPDVYKEFKEDTSGRYTGVGLEVSIRDDIVTVVAPMPNSPAEEKGLKAGDQILQINDHKTKGMSLARAVQLMRGRENTEISFKLYRPDTQKQFDVQLKRKKIAVDSMSAQLLESEFGYIRIKSFQDRSSKDFSRHLSKLRDKMNRKHKGSQAKELKGLVIDLRNNPGGLLREAVRIADQILVKGTIVSIRGRGRHFEDVAVAKDDQNEPHYPIITLVNEGSASASEILAGALQDHQRAVVLGTRTFGKGSVQSLIDLKDGSALKLTIARYYTPNGRSIQAMGIQPDIKVSRLQAVQNDEAIRESDLAGHIQQKTLRQKSTDQKRAKNGALDEKLKADVQLASALDYLKSWYVFGGKIKPPKS